VTLQELRQEIDDTDNRLLELLAERGRLVRAAWALKEAGGHERLDVAREAEVMLRLRERGRSLGLEPADVERIWREILRVRAR
jgi:isochorismate pyruvate lyase